MRELATYLLEALPLLMGACIISGISHVLEALDELITVTKCLVVVEAKKEGSNFEV